MNTYDIIFHAINAKGRRAGKLRYRCIMADNPVQAQLQFFDIPEYQSLTLSIVEVVEIAPRIPDHAPASTTSTETTMPSDQQPSMPLHYDWRSAGTPAEKIARYMDGGGIELLKDVLLITAALCPIPKSDDNDEDDGDDMACLFDSSTPKRPGIIPGCLSVFQRMAEQIAAGAVQEAPGPLLQGLGLDAFEIGILAITMARTTGLLTKRARSVRDIQDLISRDPDERLEAFNRLRVDGPLLGNDLLVSDDDNVPLNRYIELGPALMSLVLGSNDTPAPASGKRRRGRSGTQAFAPRVPSLRLDQVVLSPDVRPLIDTLIAQIAHGTQLMDTWGLGSVIPYGRGTTVLMSGPPGVGKTACAEGIAHSLDRGILEVSLPGIQSRYVGDCEKGIAAAFAAATDSGAVLFWDEVDGLISDRSKAGERQWLISQVTTFLREIERFEGVCLLATNRHNDLDPAIERRLAFKVPFSRPDAGARAAIWRLLLPDTVPLADDVDLNALAAQPLTGGQIKNVVLNAARIAVIRGPESRISAADMAQALAWEQDSVRRDTQEDAPRSRQASIAATKSGQAWPVTVPMAPSLQVNTRPLSKDAFVALEMTGYPAPASVLTCWAGRRYVTRNGSLVQLVIVPMAKDRADTLALAVLDGGHHIDRMRGDDRGSTYVVHGDGTMCGVDEEPRLDAMSVVAEVIED